MASLDLFDKKAAFLREWCQQYEHKYGKWPTMKNVYDAKLPGFISHGEVNIMMRYLNDERKDNEQQTGD